MSSFDLTENKEFDMLTSPLGMDVVPNWLETTMRSTLQPVGNSIYSSQHFTVS